MSKLHPKAKRLGRAKDHTDWLKQRSLGIGGSDAGVIMGTNPYRTMRELWGDKTGIEPNQFNGNALTEIGHYLEPHVRSLVRPDAVPGDKVGAMQSIEHPHLRANVDGLEDGLLIEIKTCGKSGWRKIPAYYMCQIQHYMLVTGQSKTLLICAAVQGDRHTIYDAIKLANLRPELVVQNMCKIKTYQIDADPNWVADYLPRSREFWAKVQARQFENKRYAF